MKSLLIDTQKKRKILVLIIALLFIVMYFNPSFVSASRNSSNSIATTDNPILTIAFDDGYVSQYQYVLPIIKAKGIEGTFYIISDAVRDVSGSSEYMSFSEIIDLQNAGNEIGSHSKTHRRFTELSETQIRQECIISKSVLESRGLNITNFAYPYGATNNSVDSIVDDYYISGRSVAYPYVMTLPFSQFRLPACGGETGDSNALSRLKNVVNQLTSNQWLIVFFHNVIPNANNKPYTISTQDFSSFLDYAISKNVRFLTVNQVLGGNAFIPTVSIVSPENMTYALADVSLNFTVSESASWIGYSLDGQANVTITGNTTLMGLLNGSHYVIVYANDTIGNMGASSTVYFTVDTTPPNITDVSQTPAENNVLPTDEVKVNATVTDDISGVKQVILNYTNGNGTWITVAMTNLEGNIWNAITPAFPYSTNVTYVIMVEDNANNTITTEEIFGYEYQYHVIPEFPSLIILPLFMIATFLAIIVHRKQTMQR